MRCAYRVLVRKCEGKRPLRRPRHKRLLKWNFLKKRWRSAQLPEDLIAS
jgi:hypothetical protein